MLYVVGSSAPKVLRRLGDDTSTPLLLALNELSSDELGSHPFAEPAELTANQIRFDNDFLQSLAAPTIQEFLRQLSLEVPNLIAQASSTRSCTFYNEKTASEFHTLLNGLFSKFKDLLTVVETMTKALDKQHQNQSLHQAAMSQSENTASPIFESPAVRLDFFNDSLNVLALTSDLLWLLIYSSALETPLEQDCAVS
jgi:hypothetical protein